MLREQRNIHNMLCFAEKALEIFEKDVDRLRNKLHCIARMPPKWKSSCFSVRIQTIKTLIKSY